MPPAKKKTSVTATTATAKTAKAEPDAAKNYRDYHAGDFQTIDPITGEKRELGQPASVVSEVGPT